MNTMTISNRVDELKNETPRGTNTYRAPRLMHLGTAADLVQGGSGLYADDPSHPFNGRHGGL
jgi:hypothetical protein